MPRAGVLAALALVLVSGPLGAEDGPALRLLVTRDLRGWLEPCDCKRGVLGGFPRRASVVGTRKPDLLLDAGDLIFQASPYDLLKLRFMLELDARLGYRAANVGRREADFSLAQIREVAEESPVPLVSANLVDSEGRGVLPGHVLASWRGERIAVVGLVTPKAHPGDGLYVADPSVALRTELREVRAKADLVVLLSALDAEEMTRVLHDDPGVDLVLGGWIPKGSEQLETIAGVPCFLVEGKGQYVGEVLLRRGQGGLRPVSGRRILLDPAVPSAPDVLSRIEDFERSLKDLDLLGRRESTSPYAGSAACAACHGEIYAKWKASGHAKALSPLRPEKGLYDPQCLACHVTAPGRGGYVSEEKTPAFAGVGCECCHGPSRAHANAPLTKHRPPTPGTPEKTCLGCHQSDHSRPFHPAERLAAIRHSREKEKDR